MPDHAPSSVADRSALLRGQLSGARSETRSGRRLAQSQAANVLVAATLHAAARRERGMELTGLEQRLTDQLAALFGEEQVAEFGRIYQEPASRTGITSLFPDVVAERSLELGLDAEDVAAWLPSVQAEIAALSNARQVSVEELDQGVLTGEEEVVVVTAPATAGTEFEIDAINEVRVRFVKFRCDRRSTELGSDEIYWGTGAASELQPQIVMLTPEYRSISTGTVKHFSPNAWFFKGPAESYIAGHIQCWEADPGGNNFNKMRQVLADAARQCTIWAIEFGISYEAALAGLTAATAALVNWILGFNKDDLVKEMTVAWSRDALVRMAQTNGGQSELVFDGGSGGKHTLTIEVTFGPVIATALRHSLYYAGDWSKQVEIPQLISGSTRPSMAVGPNARGVDALYAVYRQAGGKVTMGIYDSESWSLPRPITAPDGNPIYSEFDPSIVSYDGKSMVIWVLRDPQDERRHHTRSQFVDLATGKLYGPMASIQDSPIAATTPIVHKGSLWRIGPRRSNGVEGENVAVNHYNSSTNTWTWEAALLKIPTYLPVAAASFQERLWIFYRENNGASQGFRAMSSPDGQIWRTETLPTLMGRNSAALPPSATVASQGVYSNPRPRLFVAYASNTQPHRMTAWSFDGSTWTQSDSVTHSDGLGPWSPFLHEHAGNLHMLFNMNNEFHYRQTLMMNSDGTVRGIPHVPHDGRQLFRLISLGDGSPAIRAEQSNLLLTMNSDGTVRGMPHEPYNYGQIVEVITLSDGKKAFRASHVSDLLLTMNADGTVCGVPYQPNNFGQGFDLVPQPNGSHVFFNGYGR
ncbi:hypothetical protein [Streptomyces kronopolitis]|uniref:hypothetical protein n=1 Tax=Streptomyces kronopolitis TaxID=1612435 RepID=UPI003D9537E1